MGRKYEYNTGRHAWSLEQCEEEILIAKYVKIRNSIPPNRQWADNLEDYFFDGKGIGFEDLNELNAALKTHGLEPVEFRETEIGDYARRGDEQTKSQHRKQLREEFAKASPGVLAERLARAEAEEKRQPPAHFTYEQFKTRKLQQNAAAPLGQGDIPRRPTAGRLGDAPEVMPIVTRPPISKKRENFLRLLPERAAKVREAIHGLRNLSTSNYEYGEPEVEKTFNSLFDQLDETYNTFLRRLKKRAP
jgi:hypothetical protein